MFLDQEEENFPENVISKERNAEETKRLITRHRLDLAKLYLLKDGGYTLKKFKRIYKREMEENP